MNVDKRAHIMIIKDEKRFEDIVTFYLKREGFRVSLAFTGSEGLDKLADFPDMVILDLMFPGMDSEDICRMIRKNSHIPIIMLTAKDDQMDKIKGLSIGADDYIVKPFSPKEFIARIYAVLRRTYGKEKIENRKTGVSFIKLDTYIIYKNQKIPGGLK